MDVIQSAKPRSAEWPQVERFPPEPKGCVRVRGLGVRVQRLEHPFQEGGAEDHIRIAEEQKVAGSGMRAAIARRVGPSVLLIDDGYPSAVRSERFVQLVGGAVVHDEHLARLDRLAENALQTARDGVCALIDRDDDADGIRGARRNRGAVMRQRILLTEARSSLVRANRPPAPNQGRTDCR